MQPQKLPITIGCLSLLSDSPEPLQQRVVYAPGLCLLKERHPEGEEDLTSLLERQLVNTRFMGRVNGSSQLSNRVSE